MACHIFPYAILPEGINTVHCNPALAAYAAKEAEVLPVDAQMTDLTPSSTAFVTPTVMPLSLKEPVGFSPSFFTYSWLMPSALPKRLHLWSPVPPSFNVTIFAGSFMG